MHLVAWMRSESFLNASQCFSLRSLARGLPYFCLWWVCSSRVMSKLAASSSSGLGIIASWSDNQHCLLVLVGSASILATVGREAAGGSSLPLWPVVGW